MKGLRSVTTDDDQRGELPRRRRPGVPTQRACEPNPSSPRGGRQDRTIPLPSVGWPRIHRTGPGTVYPRGWQRLLYQLGKKPWVRWMAESVWYLVLALAAAAVASAVSTYILMNR